MQIRDVRNLVAARQRAQHHNITGAMPDPAVKNRIDDSAESGNTKLTWGATNRTMVPDSTPATR